jgi:hypothetical protein
VPGIFSTRRFYLIVAIFCLAAVPGIAQLPLLDNPARSIDKAEPVQYLYPEQLTLEAGKSTPVTLHFRIASGLHINSHTPKDQFLIPTSLTIPAGSGIKLDAADYPTGTAYALPAAPKTMLSVYTGEFAIHARLTAAPGDHLVQGKLHYQACDETQCMPPRTANVAIDVISK